VIAYCDGLSVVEGEEFFVVLEFRFTYDGGHRRVSAVSSCLLFYLVSRVVEEGLMIFVFEVPNILGHHFLFDLVLQLFIRSFALELFLWVAAG
jgi:hypothetical protein